MLSLLSARKIVDQAIRHAQDLNVTISVAVCDDTGRLIAFNQMDGSFDWESDRCAMGKAVAAAVSGFASDRLTEHIQRLGMMMTSHSNVMPPLGRRGGIPVIENGVVRGGCGVSGTPTEEQDERCALAGVAALNENPQVPRHGLSVFKLCDCGLDR
jgi:glc operon protein GlcG